MKTATQILKENGIDFKVGTVPQKYENPVTRKDEIVPDRVVIVREDTGEALGYASNRYVPISPIDAFSAVDPIVSELGMNCVEARSIDNGRQIIVEAQFDRVIEVHSDANGEVDKLIPKFYFSTRNDAFGAMRLTVGLHRLICDNGVVVPVAGLGTNVRIPHVGDADNKFRNAIDGVSVIMGSFDNAERCFNHLANCSMDEKTMAKYALVTLGIFPETGQMLTNFIDGFSGQRNKMWDDLMFRYHKNDGYAKSFKDTAWAAFNSITGNVDHGRRFRNEDTRYTSIITGDLANVKADGLSAAVAYANSEQLDQVIEDPTRRGRFIKLGSEYFKNNYTVN